MQVAAHVAELEQAGRLSAERPFAQLGRDEREPEAAIDAFLVGRCRQRLEAGHVLGRAGRAQELGAEPGRLGDDQLDGHALDRHAERPPRRPLDDRDDLRQRLESLEHRFRCVGRDDDREPLRRVPPAARVARGARRRAPRRSTRRAVGCGGVGAAGRSRRPARARARPAACARSPARSPAPPAAARLSAASRSSARLRDSEHAPDLEHPLDRDAEEAAEPGQLRRDLALELLQLGDLAGLDELRSRRSIPGPMPRSSRARPCAHELGDRRRGRRGSGRPRGGRPARCTARRPRARAARRTASSRRAISALSGGDPCTAG